MKQIKLMVFNYSRITLIADFKSNEHDAFKTLGFFNGEIAATHNGILPDNTFYFLSYKSKRTGEEKLMISDHLTQDDSQHKAKIRKATEFANTL